MGFFAVLIEFLLFSISLFMILLILIQRGKGGGLAGAFGGVGGSSAFGTRAGDAFTRLTIYIATIWVLLIMIEIRLVQPNVNDANNSGQTVKQGEPAKPGQGN